jgi:hypothetical protein
MPKQNRNTLKSFFSDGAMPSSDMFEDLIDSGININDDGFEKTDVDGLKISTTGNYKSLISLYDQQNRDVEEWVICFEAGKGGKDANDTSKSLNNLVIGYPDKNETSANPARGQKTTQINHAICLDKSEANVRLGVGHQLPKDALDVAGNIRSPGRRGSFGQSFHSVQADSNWYSITEPLRGGVALEVMARAMNPGKKYYGMMHAIALHTPWNAKRDLAYFLGLKNRIRYTHGFYDSMLHKLKLRWRRIKGEDGYRLQIRSNCKYGTAGVLDFHITCLWSDDDEFTPMTDPVEAPAND